ncbi:hypothetical protein BDP27DRAFT_1449443 [Rhodocollybia butyracea]|uniref:Uncharacterized protein n=1 Tax=Rhodocollybia butyracea TaxID=206335 RepID=A0A9P5PJS1_9AGAR|nr:hypothetical protein BDP27DRAFT_1449443 [Rhodocollybia butyracea]
MSVSLDVLPSALQSPNITSNISGPETFSPLDVQDHSTPHMKTRVAVRDRTPHRFQIVPLKDAKRQPSDTTTPLSNSRKALKDITNSVLTSGRSTRLPAVIKGTHRQAFSIVDKPKYIVQPKTPSAQNKDSSVADVQSQSGFVSPLNIVKRSPPGNVNSTRPSTRLRSPTTRSSSVKPEAATSATSVRPVFDFLNGPAESTPTLSKHRSRSSNTSKHPTPSTRTRLNSDSPEAGEYSDSHSTTSTPTSPMQSYGPLHLVAKDAVMTTSSAKECVSTAWCCASKLLNSAPSTRTTLKTRIPSAKLKATSQARTLVQVPLQGKHGITHSMDATSGNSQAPRRRQAQNIRSVYNRYETPQATDDKTTSSTEQHPSPILRAPIRLRNSINSETPLETSKRHAIYTRSLYVGRAEKSPDNYIRALHGAASPPSLRRAFTSALAECSSHSCAQSDSLDSIVQAYENGTEPHRSFFGLTASLSEPTLHDISGLSFGLACDDVPSNTPGIIITGASISLSSLSSVYSQDSWEEERQNVLFSSSNENNADTSLGDQRNVDIGHHPIVWELLQKLESEEQSWWFNAGLDGKL